MRMPVGDLLQQPGIQEAWLGKQGLMLIVDATRFVAPYGWSKYDEQGRKRPVPQVRNLDDQEVLRLVRDWLLQVYPRVYAGLTATFDWNAPDLEPNQVQVCVRTLFQRKLPFPVRLCSRCEGTGEHSFNDFDGSICYGCGGVGLAPRTDHPVVDLVRAQVGDIVQIYYAQFLVVARDGEGRMRVQRLGDGATGTIARRAQSVVYDVPEDAPASACPPRHRIEKDA